MLNKKYNLSIFIFRRDLRLDDNTGLINALLDSKYVIPLFIFTPAQVSDRNKYKSSNAIQFMIESLYDLDNQINATNKKCHLWSAYGNELDIIKKISNWSKVDAIYFNDDYTPYAIKRDRMIEKFCQRNKIDCQISTDCLLVDNAFDLVAKNENAYHNFTLFYKKAVKNKIRRPKKSN